MLSCGPLTCGVMQCSEVVYHSMCDNSIAHGLCHLIDDNFMCHNLEPCFCTGSLQGQDGDYNDIAFTAMHLVAVANHWSCTACERLLMLSSLLYFAGATTQGVSLSMSPEGHLQ